VSDSKFIQDQFSIISLFSTSDLRRHLPEAERRKDVVECHICQKQLYSKKGMTRHLETHSTDLKYKCNECGKELKTGSSYYGHVYYHELRRKGKNIKCPACPAKFHRATALEIHLRTHSGEKPFGCTYCDMKYADRSDLRRHMWHHTGESPYKCKMCGKMFTRKDYLRKHESSCNTNAAWPTD
jgi:KRAB domain-containing zinc finger protein